MPSTLEERFSREVTALHLAIDVQSQFLKDLPQGQRFKICEDVGAFASAIRPRIPTMWVSYGTAFHLHAGSVTRRTHQQNTSLKEKCGLSHVGVELDEDIIIKSHNGAFEDRSFCQYITQRYPRVTTLIISGMNASACVADTLGGGLNNGFQCVAAVDLITDTCRPHKELVGRYNLVVDSVYASLGHDPITRCSRLLTDDEFNDSTRNLVFMTSAEILQALEENPVLSDWATPSPQFSDFRL